MRSPRAIFAGGGRVVVDQVDQDLAAVAGVDRTGRVEHRHAQAVRPARSAGAPARRTRPAARSRRRSAPAPARRAPAPRPRRRPGRRRRRPGWAYAGSGRSGSSRRTGTAHVGHGHVFLGVGGTGGTHPAILPCPPAAARRTLTSVTPDLGARAPHAPAYAERLTRCRGGCGRPRSRRPRCWPPRCGWAPPACAPGCRSRCCSRWPWSALWLAGPDPGRGHRRRVPGRRRPAAAGGGRRRDRRWTPPGKREVLGVGARPAGLRGAAAVDRPARCRWCWTTRPTRRRTGWSAPGTRSSWRPRCSPTAQRDGQRR